MNTCLAGALLGHRSGLLELLTEDETLSGFARVYPYNLDPSSHTLDCLDSKDS